MAGLTSGFGHKSGYARGGSQAQQDQNRERSWRDASRGAFANDADALAQYDAYLKSKGMGLYGGIGDSPGSGWRDVIGGAELTATGYQQANQLRRAQGALGTSLALTNRANPMAALREAGQQQAGVDYAGPRQQAIGTALEQYDALLAQKKSREIAMMQARQQMQDQYLGAGTSAAGALLAQYAASRGQKKAPA